MSDISIHERSQIIAERIRAERKALNLTQEELAGEVAALTGDEVIGQNTISDWERGISIPPLNRIFALSKLFQCDCGYLLGDYEEKTHNENYISEETGLSPESVRYLCSARKWGFGDQCASVLDLLIWDEGHYKKREFSRSLLSLLWFFFKFDGTFNRQMLLDGSITEAHGNGYIDSALNLTADVMENAVLVEIQSTIRKLKKGLRNGKSSRTPRQER
ncbi:MAG: helix-turn-helix transcriptional regulator [Oscillospiraceae bacterium]|nr:helix-turn-helix transcriptional regulator [Oscillospiraceae bacterium]